MISSQLIDLLNSREAVSILGNGISVDAGIPTWGDLFNSVADALDCEKHNTRIARRAATEGKLPEAFELLAEQTDRSDIHARTAVLIDQVSTPGALHTELADWPFRFHVTTNYDHLIEAASSGRLVTVGNRGSELHKVTGGGRDLVWHLHGGCRLSSDISHLVVAKSDYDDFYPSSNMVDKLKAIATAHRCVFVGFSFNDEDFAYVLRAVGRLAHAGRPSFAFIGYEDMSAEAKRHQDLLRSDYNVEVIPYLKRGTNHAAIHRVLERYTPFVLRHSISHSRVGQAPPTYDPVASSLNIQSSLDICEMSTASASLRKTLIGARVIAHIRANPQETDAGLEPIYRSGDPKQAEVLECVATLRERGTVTPSPTLNLTPDYWTKTEVAKAQLDLVRGPILQLVAGPGSRTKPGPRRSRSEACDRSGVSLSGKVMSGAGARGSPKPRNLKCRRGVAPNSLPCPAAP